MTYINISINTVQEYMNEYTSKARRFIKCNANNINLQPLSTDKENKHIYNLIGIINFLLMAIRIFA